jgi:hypothetical protein
MTSDVFFDETFKVRDLGEARNSTWSDFPAADSSVAITMASGATRRRRGDRGGLAYVPRSVTAFIRWVGVGESTNLG